MIRWFVVCLSLALAYVPSASAARWPKIPKNEWALEKVQEFPNAEAVILLQEATVHFDDDARSSYVEVYTRIKILNDEGTQHGTISLGSSDYLRTKNLEGRTHLPGGKVVELSDDATFEKEYSDYYGYRVVSCAMPEVVPGAIIEYRYRTFFDSIFYPRMWYFQSRIPTLSSRVTYQMPERFAFAPLVYRTLPDVEIKEDVKQNVSGASVTYSAVNLPPVPDEPRRFPFVDLAARVMLLPTGMRQYDGMLSPLFDTWEHTIDMVWQVEGGYRDFLGDKAKARKHAKELCKGLNTAEQKAAAVYRWVRDEVESEGYVGVWTGDKDVDRVFSDRKVHSNADKALLLQAMLDGVKVDSRLGWANPRHEGRVEQNIPNPSQFEDVLVVLDLGAKRLFLDPTRRDLAFGALRPSLQGVPCLLVTKKDSEWVMTPQLAAEDSRREASLDLKVDDEGRVSGSGALLLTGNHAFLKLLWKNTPEETIEAWTDWVEESYPGYDITEVEVNEDVEARQVDVRWQLSLRDEEILGDEVGVPVAAPLEIDANPFTLPAHQRRTPVQLSFPDLDRVRLKLSWPEGWVVDGEPRLAQIDNGAGHLKTSFEMDEEARTLAAERELVIAKNEFIGAAEYAKLRALYLKTVSNDSEELLLVAQ